MTYINRFFQFKLLSIFTLLFGVLTFIACTETPKEAVGLLSGTSEVKGKLVEKGNANVVQATAIHDHAADEHKFMLNTNQVSAGWNTFKFVNASDSDHFFMLYKAPAEAIAAAEAAGESLLEHWYNTVTVPFQEEFNPYIKGDISYGDFVNNLIGSISSSSPWFLDPGATTMGGPGITASGEKSYTTVNLSPGSYIVECYVKGENQEFHSYNGMLDILTVTNEQNSQPEPSATMDVTVSQAGIEYPASVRPGKHTIAINFKKQPQFGYEHLLGHNVQLVKLKDNYEQSLLDDLSEWMDWTKEGGLVKRAPEGVVFKGGSMEMPGGYTAYFNVNLKPGNYAWIAEVPDPAAKGMLKTFSVPFGRQAGKSN